MALPPPPPPVPGTGPTGYADEGPGHRASTPPPPTGRGWAALASGEQVELAGPGARLGARIIDALIIVAILLILSFTVLSRVVELDDSGGASAPLGVILIATVIGIAYEVVLIAVRGQTLGKMIVKIKVVRADFGGVPGAGKSVIRWIIPAAVAWLPFLGALVSLLVYISLLWDSNRQGWHDKAARTLVVKVSY